MRTGRQRNLIAQFALLWATSAAWTQVPFSLDTTFRTNIVDQNVNAIHILEDGKIFLSGRIRFPGDISVRGSARLLPTGQQDPSFTGFWGGGKVVPWVDNKFYVGVSLPRRMLPDGMLDPSFIALYNSPYFQGGGGGGSDFHVFPDGRVLLSGSSHILSDTARGFVGNYDLIWFSNEGYLDTTRTHRNGNGAVYRFAELPDGKFICNGTGSTFEGVPVDRIFRVHADGAPDTTFSTGVFIGSANAYLPLPDGRVYVGGNFQTTQAPGDTLRLARFMPDGTLDTTFDIPQFDDGVLGWPFGAGVSHIHTWSDGRLIVTGLFQFVNGEPRRGICIIDSTGLVLDTFNDHGVGVFLHQNIPYATVSSIALDTANNHLYLCGAYVGYADGTTNDPLQRFVSRLHLGDISTAVQEAAPAEEGYLHLYPNPASDQAFLHPPPGLQGPAQLLLSDALGRRVWEHHMAATEERVALPVAGLRPGLYVVELRSGNATWRARLVRE
jgi:uncharacterized delta-60 repeat protein